MPSYKTETADARCVLNLVLVDGVEATIVAITLALNLSRAPVGNSVGRGCAKMRWVAFHGPEKVAE